MEIKAIKDDHVFVEFTSDTGLSTMQIWLPKQMLRDYGIETKGLKVGMTFEVKPEEES